jgi:hypothetical protein
VLFILFLKANARRFDGSMQAFGPSSCGGNVEKSSELKSATECRPAPAKASDLNNTLSNAVSGVLKQGNATSQNMINQAQSATNNLGNQLNNAISTDSNAVSSPEGTSYCLSDNTDISDAQIGSLLTLAITSGDKAALSEFRKRMEGSVASIKIDLCMSSLVQEEMAQIFCKMTKNEQQFKFDIVGGNPCKFTANASAVENSCFYSVVSDTLVSMFGEKYNPTNNADSTSSQLGRWTINLVVDTLSSALQTDSSLFMEYSVDLNHILKYEQFASSFLMLVAGKLKAKVSSTVEMSLKHLFGESGFGNAFEYTSHTVLDNVRGNHMCIDSQGKIVSVALGEKRKVLIRTINDIKNLKTNERGVPTISNFPFVDQIIPPNQFTTSKIHTSSAKISEIIQALGLKEEGDFILVFIVPKEILASFSFPKNLGNIKMLVTTPEVYASNEFKRLTKDRMKSASTKKR